MTLDPPTMLEWSARICCAGLFIQSLELIRLWRHLRDDGVFGWTGASSATRPALARLAGRWHRFPQCLVLLGLRAAAASAVLLLPLHASATWWLLLLLLILQTYCNRRFHLLRENADAMFLAGLATVVVGLRPGGSASLALGAAAFLSFQVGLAYGAAGWVKLRSGAWRNGSYLAAVLEERGVFAPGSPTNRPYGRTGVIVVTWTVIAFELLFPVAVFLPTPLFGLFVASGILFHAAVTLVMGVHGFWWSFLAGYPALCLVHDFLRGRL